jgi:hypothetical protein
MSSLLQTRAPYLTSLSLDKWRIPQQPISTQQLLNTSLYTLVGAWLSGKESSNAVHGWHPSDQDSGGSSCGRVRVALGCGPLSFETWVYGF